LYLPLLALREKIFPTFAEDVFFFVVVEEVGFFVVFGVDVTAGADVTFGVDVGFEETTGDGDRDTSTPGTPEADTAGVGEVS
jgi:hypothetical protein